MKRSFGVVLTACALLGMTPAHAHDYASGDLRIDHPYARATPPGARTAAVYLTVDNRGAQPDRLVGAKSPRGAVEMHDMRQDGGVMRMREVREIVVPPRHAVRLAPGGLHLMMVDPAAPLRAGERVPLTLVFARAGNVDVEIAVEDMTAAPAPHTH
jgi:copper(I)-binding protein